MYIDGAGQILSYVQNSVQIQACREQGRREKGGERTGRREEKDGATWQCSWQPMVVAGPDMLKYDSKTGGHACSVHVEAKHVLRLEILQI